MARLGLGRLGLVDGLVVDLGGQVNDMRGHPVFGGDVGFKLELVRSEPNPVPVLELPALDALAVDEDAIGAVQILAQPALAYREDGRMAFGNSLMRQLDRVVLFSANGGPGFCDGKRQMNLALTVVD